MKIGIDVATQPEKVVYMMKGNYLSRDGSFYPLEVLYQAWKKEIGTHFQGLDGIIADVQVNEEQELIYIYIIKDR